jgi:DNA ligase-1
MTLTKPMLAYKLSQEEIDSLDRYPYLVSPKLDGVRATVQNGVLLSRSLKPIPNRYCQALFGNSDLEGCDGELIVGKATDPHVCDTTRSGVMSRSGEPDVVFHVFDLCNIQTWDFEDRLRESMETVADARSRGIDRVRSLPHRFVNKPDKLTVFEAWFLGRAYEGMMLRDPRGVYKQGRSTFNEQGLMAIKRFTDAEALIVDTYEQERNGNAVFTSELGRSKRSTHKAGKTGKGTLGGFTCVPLIVNPTAAIRAALVDAGPKQNGSFNVSTGFGLTDSVRADLWAKRKILPGKILKYKYQATGTKDKPRIPLFVALRDSRDMN